MRPRCAGIIQECYSRRPSDAGTGNGTAISHLFQAKHRPIPDSLGACNGRKPPPDDGSPPLPNDTRPARSTKACCSETLIDKIGRRRWSRRAHSDRLPQRTRNKDRCIRYGHRHSRALIAPNLRLVHASCARTQRGFGHRSFHCSSPTRGARPPARSSIGCGERTGFLDLHAAAAATSG